MKNIAFVTTCLLVSACGGSPNRTTTVPPPVEDPDLDEAVEPITDPEPEAPPPPQQWSARAELVPVKGARMKARVVTFTQTDGGGAEVAGDDAFVGLEAGTYHLVIHEAGDCGKNATKAGPIWPETASVSLPISVTKASPGALAATDVDLMLGGDTSIVGRTLVLHDDKKGKPGKAVACGAITSDRDDDAED